jgi:hypothetical protein
MAGRARLATITPIGQPSCTHSATPRTIPPAYGRPRPLPRAFRRPVPMKWASASPLPRLCFGASKKAPEVCASPVPRRLLFIGLPGRDQMRAAAVAPVRSLADLRGGQSGESRSCPDAATAAAKERT